MAELADALDLGSSAERRAGSSPVPGTRCEVPRFARDFANGLTPTKRLKFKSCSRHHPHATAFSKSRLGPRKVLTETSATTRGKLLRTRRFRLEYS